MSALISIQTYRIFRPVEVLKYQTNNINMTEELLHLALVLITIVVINTF